MQVANFGQDPLPNCQLHLSVGLAIVADTTFDLAFMQRKEITFNNAFIFNQTGNIEIGLVISYPQDQNTANNELQKIITIPQEITAIGRVYDFYFNNGVEAEIVFQTDNYSFTTVSDSTTGDFNINIIAGDYRVFGLSEISVCQFIL